MSSRTVTTSIRTYSVSAERTRTSSSMISSSGRQPPNIPSSYTTTSTFHASLQTPPTRSWQPRFGPKRQPQYASHTLLIRRPFRSPLRIFPSFKARSQYRCSFESHNAMGLVSDPIRMGQWAAIRRLSLALSARRCCLSMSCRMAIPTEPGTSVRQMTWLMRGWKSCARMARKRD